MKSLSKHLQILTIGLVLISINFSCKKEKDTLVKIKIVNDQNERVEDAMVRLWPNPDPVLGAMIPADTAYTNHEGFAYFDYTNDFNLGQAGLRVLDIEVKFEDYAGEGIIKIIEEEDNEQTVVISQP
jgi:hypothetical protein